MELIEALKVIRETCLKSKFCEKCPLRSCDNGCHIQENAPENWEFAGADIPPRVFE